MRSREVVCSVFEQAIPVLRVADFVSLLGALISRRLLLLLLPPQRRLLRKVPASAMILAPRGAPTPAPTSPRCAFLTTPWHHSMPKPENTSSGTASTASCVETRWLPWLLPVARWNVRDSRNTSTLLLAPSSIVCRTIAS